MLRSCKMVNHASRCDVQSCGLSPRSWRDFRSEWFSWGPPQILPASQASPVTQYSAYFGFITHHASRENPLPPPQVDKMKARNFASAQNFPGIRRTPRKPHEIRNAFIFDSSNAINICIIHQRKSFPTSHLIAAYRAF